MSYFIFQKFMGLGLILSSILGIYAFELDTVYLVIGVPLGLWLIVSRQKLLIIDEDEDKESQ